jgi:hypothetical protein
MRGLITPLLITAGMIFLANYAEAGCVGTSVAAFGAKGDGHTVIRPQSNVLSMPLQLQAADRLSSVSLAITRREHSYCHRELFFVAL